MTLKEAVTLSIMTSTFLIRFLMTLRFAESAFCIAFQVVKSCSVLYLNITHHALNIVVKYFPVRRPDLAQFGLYCFDISIAGRGDKPKAKTTGPQWTCNFELKTNATER